MRALRALRAAELAKAALARRLHVPAGEVSGVFYKPVTR